MSRLPSKETPPVPEAELEVLSCLSRLGQAEVSQLRAQLRPTRRLSHASIVTLLQRLKQRGLVQRRKAEVGKAFVYFPTTQAPSAFQQATRRLLTRVFHSDSVSLISSLFGASQPRPEEIQRLRQLVEELESRKPRGGKR